MSRSDENAPPRPVVVRGPWAASSEPTGGANGGHTRRYDTPLGPWEVGAGIERSAGKTPPPGAEQSATTWLSGLELPSGQAPVPEVPPVGALRRLHDAQVLQIAEGIRAETGASYQADPRVLAFHLGIDVVPGSPEARETPTSTEAPFAWHPDRRERGIRIYCAVVRSFFLARRIAHGHGDVWALAIELALPTQERWIGAPMLCVTQRFCPESVIRTYVPSM